MALKRVTAPATEPATLAEAKLHLRVDGSEEDSLITAKIVAAREDLEISLRRALITQTWELTLDAWPAGDTLEIPLPPLQSVTSVTYKDQNGITATFSSASYAVDSDSEPGRVRLMPGATWPSLTLYPVSAIRVRFVCGYGAASAVPEGIRQALLLLTGHYYENREAVAAMAGGNLQELPMGIESLIWRHRFLKF